VSTLVAVAADDHTLVGAVGGSVAFFKAVAAGVGGLCIISNDQLTMGARILP
jgi:hypothetical protein